MPEVRYMIVGFSDGVAIVAKNWLVREGGSLLCRWPNHIKVHKAAKNLETPTEDWSTHKVTKVMGKVDDWQVAVNKLRKLEEEGNCDTTDVERKRKRKATKLYRGEEDSDSDDYISVSTPVTKRVHLPTPPSPLISISSLLTANSEEPSTPLQSTSSANLDTDIEAASTGDIQEQNSNSEPTGCANAATPQPQLPTIEKALERIFQAIESLRAGQDRLLRTLRANRERPESKCTEEEELPLDVFPLQTRDDLLNFEKELREKKGLRKGCITYLSAYGAADAKEEVRRILGEVLGHDVALQYNYSGKGKQGRHAFKDLALYKIIFDVARSSHAELKEMDFRYIVKRWLNGAEDRKGGKKRREAAKAGERAELNDSHADQ